MPHARISAPSLAVDPMVYLWSLIPHPSNLPYSFRHTLQRIKRKTHGRTRARESSCCVRPFQGGQERAVSKGVARMSLCTLPDLIKGPFATDGWLFAGDFVKDFSVVDGPGSARSRQRRLLVFLNLRGHPGRFTFDCALIDRPKFHFDYELFRPEPRRFVWPTATANPLYIRFCAINYSYIPGSKLTLFVMSY